MLETLIKPIYLNSTMIPVNRPLISAEDMSAVTEALENTWISGDTPPIIGLEVKLKEILGVSDVIAVSSGTTAIDLAVEALDIQPGDECVVPTLSCHRFQTYCVMEQSSRLSILTL
jgi:perosamine synthetase